MEGPSSAQATLAHYWDDAADALTGDQQQPIASIAEPTSSVLNTVLVGAATIISVFWLGHWLNAWRRARRQKKFDLDLRRRHGIPDSDTRPFNVAYQAASIAARDARKSLSIQSEHSQTHPFTSDTAPSTANIQEGFRPQGRSRPPIPHFPGQPLVRVPSGSFNFSHQQPAYASASSLDLSRAVSHLPNAVPAGSWGPRYAADNFRATSVPAVPTVSSRSAFAVAAASGSVRSNNGLATGINSGDRRTWHSGNRPVSISRANVNSQARSRKRLYLTADEEAEEEEPSVPTDKRSRTAGWGSEAMIDGDNEPTWAQSHEIEPRVVSESSVPQVGKSKGKRPADDGEGDLRTDGKRRHTKQRPKASSVQEKRGIKRERKEVDTASVLNDVMPVHKRGRAGDVDNDLSMVKEEDIDDEDDPTVSRNPLCGGRRIGQKWTSNGQEYMVGPNGDRLRLVNVKESRKKYYMPADSKHADNFHTVEVFVEKWLTEEQYARAKADGLLAWQENDNLPANIKQESPERIPLEDKENQNEEGLRAISTTAITLSRSRAANTIWNTPGQSPLQPNSPHTNPFNNPLSASAPQSPGPRRVKYSIGTVPAAALNANRIKSTWEKQEREATGLKILRERAAAQAAANAPPAPAPAPAPAPVVPTLTIPPSITAPSITVTAASPLPTSKPADKPAETKPAFSFAPVPKPAEPTPATAAPTPAPANPFSFAAPKKDEPAKPLFPAAPATSSTPFPQLTPSASSATPALGAAPSTAPAPPAVTPSPFAAPAATPTTVAPSPFAAPASTPAAKPSPFAFSAPSQPPTTAAPAEAPKPFATPASTPFGTTPAPGAPAPFGTTPSAPAPAATKPSGGFSFGVTPAAPAATPAATPAGSTLFSAQPAKPATSGFSFNAGNTIANGASDVKPAGSGFSFSTTPASSAPASTGFGATASKPNVFGSTAATTSATTPSGFGTGTGFGASNAATGTAASSSPFAFSAPKAPAAAPTPSGFGAQPAAPTSNGFKFGETKAATPAAAPAAGSTFSFGAPAKPTVAIPTSNPFNVPSTTTPTTATNGGFTFGAGAAAGAAASPGTPSKPVFNLGAAASPVMGTRTISTSKRVQRAMSKPPQ